MKVAIASDDGVHIAGHLGRTRGFIIYEIENEQVTNRDYIENTFTGHARGLSGAGHSADRHGPILQALEGCRAVISAGMGRRIYADLVSAGIDTFIVNENNADRAVDLFMKDRLQNYPDKGCEH